MPQRKHKKKSIENKKKKTKKNKTAITKMKNHPIKLKHNSIRGKVIPSCYIEGKYNRFLIIYFYYFSLLVLKVCKQTVKNYCQEKE